MNVCLICSLCVLQTELVLRVDRAPYYRITDTVFQVGYSFLPRYSTAMKPSAGLVFHPSLACTLLLTIRLVCR